MAREVNRQYNALIISELLENFAFTIIIINFV